MIGNNFSQSVNNNTFLQDTFKTQLLEQAEELKNNAKSLLERFTTQGPFTSEWTAKDALANLASIREQLAAYRAEEAQLRKDLAIFNISHPDSPELAKLEQVNINCVSYSVINNNNAL